MKLTTLRNLAIGLSTVLTFGTAGGASAETLRVGMECTYAPFNYKTADGDLAARDRLGQPQKLPRPIRCHAKNDCDG